MKAGTAAWSAHSTSCPATQVTHVNRSPRVVTVPAHGVPPGAVTAGQVETNPSVAGATSSAPPHVPSGPPHARQIAALARAAADAIAAPARPSLGSGHGFACAPEPRDAQQV